MSAQVSADREKFGRQSPLPGSPDTMACRWQSRAPPGTARTGRWRGAIADLTVARVANRPLARMARDRNSSPGSAGQRPAVLAQVQLRRLIMQARSKAAQDWFRSPGTKSPIWPFSILAPDAPGFIHGEEGAGRLKLPKVRYISAWTMRRRHPLGKRILAHCSSPMRPLGRFWFRCRKSAEYILRRPSGWGRTCNLGPLSAPRGMTERDAPHREARAKAPRLQAWGWVTFG
jgi:hypothetical protein